MSDGPTKACADCGLTKPLDDFHRRAGAKDGRRSDCKECHLPKRAKWREANRDRTREYFAALSAAKPHRGWEGGYIHRARKAGFEPVVESFTREDLVRAYGDKCYLCDGPFEELDHVVEVHEGGSHTLENCRPSCRDCNWAKHVKSNPAGGQRKLTPGDASKVRQAVAEGRTQKSLAAEYGVSAATIHNIKFGRTYKEVIA